MTRTEDRLADALDAAACAVREGTLSPLIVPSRQRRTRHVWAAPIAAAAALLLAVGVGAAVSDNLPGAGHAAPVTAAAGPPPRYYVASELGVPGGSSTLVVRATATGAVTDSLYIRNLAVPDKPAAQFGVITAAANGEFFISAGNLAVTPNSDAIQQIYRFRLTSTGRIAGLSQVPDGSISAQVSAMAASPDGSELAVSTHSDDLMHPDELGQSQRILVINIATGARTVWQGGMARRGDQFGIASLSWAGNGRELVFLGQWFKINTSVIRVGTMTTTIGGLAPSADGLPPSDAQVWALDPTSGGGALTAGQMLLRQSAQYPAIEQAAISADGTTLTAAVGNRSADARTPAAEPAAHRFSIDQISVATGTQLGTLFQGNEDLVAWQLISDGLAGHWLILGTNINHTQTTFSGWIRDGRLITLPGITQDTLSEAWSAPVLSPPARPVVRQPTTAGTPPRYYVETNTDGQVVVRSTATGAVTATADIPRSPGALVTAAGNGMFFVAAGVPGSAGPALYEFRLTGAGNVTGLSKLPGGAIGTKNEEADAIAAAPDGSQVAVAIGPEGGFCSGLPCPTAEDGKGADYIAVINVATGARRLWQGGMPSSLYIPSLSWTANGRELVFLGQTCPADASYPQFATACGFGQRSQSWGVWALDPVSGGGRLDSAHRLLRQSAAYPDIVQAVINPDGSTITAVLLAGSASHSPSQGQAIVSVAQISVATGKQLTVLYTEVVGGASTDQTVAPFVTSSAPLLSADGTGRYWLLAVPYPEVNGTERNGWIRAGQLVELPPGGASVASEAW